MGSLIFKLLPQSHRSFGRIALEAVRNAFLHAGAARIEAEICYHTQEFRVRVGDNGKGIAPEIIQHGRIGYYGLTGMYERAKLERGELVFWSELGFGTEIELTVPASVAYAKTPGPRVLSASALFKKLGRIFS